MTEPARLSPFRPAKAANTFDREDLFAALAQECLPALRAYAQCLTGDAHRADDCVQDAFVSALGAFTGYDRARPFRLWIFRILRNEWLQRLRRDRRLTDLPDAAISALLIDTRTPEDAAEGARLLALIARLPPSMADAVTLVLAQGFSYEEAAALCKCAPGTMKSRVSRARALLVVQIQENGPGSA